MCFHCYDFSATNNNGEFEVGLSKRSFEALRGKRKKKHGKVVCRAHVFAGFR